MCVCVRVTDIRYYLSAGFSLIATLVRKTQKLMLGQAYLCMNVNRVENHSLCKQSSSFYAFYDVAEFCKFSLYLLVDVSSLSVEQWVGQVSRKPLTVYTMLSCTIIFEIYQRD